MLVAQRVRRLRREQGLSLRELASRSGLSEEVLSCLERADCNVTLDCLGKVAEGLRVKAVYLVNVGTDDKARLVEGTRNMSQQECKQALHEIKGGTMHNALLDLFSLHAPRRE